MNDILKTLRAKLIQEHERTKTVKERLLQHACKELAKIALEKGLHGYTPKTYEFHFAIIDQTSQEWVHADGFYAYADFEPLTQTDVKIYETEGLTFKVTPGCGEKQEPVYHVRIITDVTKPIFIDFTQSATHAMSKDLYAPTEPTRP